MSLSSEAYKFIVLKMRPSFLFPCIPKNFQLGPAPLAVAAITFKPELSTSRIHSQHDWVQCVSSNSYVNLSLVQLLSFQDIQKFSIKTKHKYKTTLVYDLC